MSLLYTIPSIVRARGFYLYTKTGKRIVDLWQDGGKAILGHKPPGLLRELKNSSERALFAPFPHTAQERFFKALLQLFPAKAFRVYQHKSVMYSALQRAGFQTENGITDPALSPCQQSPCTLWRPFIKIDDAPILVPILPWSWSPQVLVVDPHLDFPLESDIISTALLSGATRAVHNLVAALKAKRSVSPLLQESMQNTLWNLKGIYVHIRRPESCYEALFRLFFEAGFLIPPDPLTPLILPESLSKGEEAHLAQLFKKKIV